MKYEVTVSGGFMGNKGPETYQGNIENLPVEHQQVIKDLPGQRKISEGTEAAMDQQQYMLKLTDGHNTVQEVTYNDLTIPENIGKFVAYLKNKATD